MARFIAGSRRKMLFGLVSLGVGGIYFSRDFSKTIDQGIDNGKGTSALVSDPEIKKRSTVDLAKGFAACIKAHCIKWQLSVKDKLIEYFFTSQELPEDWDKYPVKVLVASNFDEVAFDKSKDVLVKFYSPECNPCNDLSKIYDELGELYKENEKIIVAKMDASVNILKHTKIKTVPQIKLYRSGDNKVFSFERKRTLESLIKFLESRGEALA